MKITHSNRNKVTDKFKVGEWFLFSESVYFVIIGVEKTDGDYIYTVFSATSLLIETISHTDLVVDRDYRYLGECKELNLVF